MTNATSRCLGCFAAPSEPVCPRCGWDENTPRPPLYLPVGTLLHGEYLIGRPLGQPGGFGLTYLGWHRVLEHKVAIKEYLPRKLAGRDASGVAVRSHLLEDEVAFVFGREQFVAEARMLVRLAHPNIVKVRNFFEANGTAYLVMDYAPGQSFTDLLAERGGRLPEGEAVALLLPILDALQYVHEQGYLHRDVKPGNLYLREGGEPLLLDFGSARQALIERSQSTSLVRTPGYSPFEQYHARGQQGAWTDIYAAAATLYSLVTGAPLPPAPERMEEDTLVPPERLVPALSPTFCRAVLKGLAVTRQDRPQSAAEFRTLLTSPDKPAALGEGKGFDVFISYSSEDREWVRGELLKRIEQAGLKAFIDFRDFTRGAPIIKEMERGVVEGRKTLLILTPNYIKSEWAEIENIMVATLSPANRDLRLIPLLKAECTKPLRIGALTHIDFTDGADHDLAWWHLLTALVKPPEPEHEPQRESPTLPEAPAPAPNSPASPEIQGPTETPPTSPSPAPGAPGEGTGVRATTANPGKSHRWLYASIVGMALAGIFPLLLWLWPLWGPEGLPKRPADRPEYVPIPARIIVVNCTPTSPCDILPVPRFWLGKTEVTVAEYMEFAAGRKDHPRPKAPLFNTDWKIDNQPMVNVTWRDASVYCEWTGGRLPSEEEWEYAARGGLIRSKYPWGNDDPVDEPKRKNGARFESKKGPTLVGSYVANGYGLFDMAGNVFEWCETIRGEHVDKEKTHRVTLRGLRGGAWKSSATSLLVSVGTEFDPSIHSGDFIGFRCAIDEVP